MNHTKGEWRVHPIHKTDVYALHQGSHFIADCHNPHLPKGEAEANAYLIAKSPRMFELLKQLADWDAGKFGKQSNIKIIEISKQASLLLEGKIE